MDKLWYYDYSFGKACIVDCEGFIVVPFFECTEHTARTIVKEHNKAVTFITLEHETGE